jgi:hypothetical protein
MDSKKAIQKLLTARFIVDSLVEDYCRVVSKIESSDINYVKERISKRADELLKEFKEQNPLDEPL